ncbi:hypothetical protein J5N97_016185 [Dioscorea zingiberensis]|uniref:GDSL esterase/lipase EXL3 n=1 Tax=Dioscorea zingiberensis TaxID=325984 RepID=A0A9D5HF66_9LILI|nr:hypothetical protein J5N97_016185 [Dioscorea zingiberensis]
MGRNYEIKEKYCLQYSTLILFLFKFLHVLSSSTPPPKSPPAVFIFGDSIVDPGNNNVLKTLIKCNFPPYGQDFPAHRPTGRFSNGKIPSDFIVSGLGVKELLPPYLGDDLPPEEIITGVSFASSGSGYDPLTPVIVSVLSMTDQLKLFEEYKVKLRSIVGDERAESIVLDSMYVVCAGSDDLANTYFTTPFRSHFDVPSYIDLMVSSASSFLEQLHQGGARKVGFVGLPPIGCLPSQRTLGGGLSRECVTSRNEAASLFNSKMANKIGELGRVLNSSRIIFLDIYTIFMNIIQQPHVYGFDESTRGCCGSGKLEVSVLSKCNFPPYGKNFPGHIATGRCSDGKILSDFLALGLGVKILLPPYLGVAHSQEEFSTGFSFASKGSGYDPLTPVPALALSLEEQLKLFEEYKVKLRNMTGDERAESIVSKSLYIVSVGTDDVITYFKRLNLDVNSYIDHFMVPSALSFLKKLYQGGARKIGVVGLPPIGCLPSQRTLVGGLLRECSTFFNEAASLFNSKIKSKIGELERMLNGTRIGYFDIYDIVINLIQRPQDYGFEETTLGCCGTGLLETAVACNSLSSTCANATTHLFWDSFHPTEKGYDMLTAELFKRSSIRELAKQSP